MYHTHTFGSSEQTPVLTPMVEELNKLDKKLANKTANYIMKTLKQINSFHESSNDSYFREYMRKHMRTDIINRCEGFPDSIKSFVRNFLLTKLRMHTNYQPKLKCGHKPTDIIGSVLFTDKPTHDKVIKTDMVMLLDSETGLYNRVWKNRYGKQGYIHTKRVLPDNKKEMSPNNISTDNIIMSTVQPIRPQEVVTKKVETIPNVVIEAFNELIAKNYTGYSATVKQDDIIKLIRSKDETISRKHIFDNHWLDVEDIYRKNGWVVEYDKPGYNESYDARFIFKKK